MSQLGAKFLKKQSKIRVKYQHYFCHSIEGLVMKLSTLFAVFIAMILSACATTYQYQTPADSQKFYADKLSCENLYTLGFNVWGNKVYGNIYQEGPARDCMLSKGYQSLN